MSVILCAGLNLNAKQGQFKFVLCDILNKLALLVFLHCSPEKPLRTSFIVFLVCFDRKDIEPVLLVGERNTLWTSGLT